MNPEHAIAPTRLIRRRGMKKWHMAVHETARTTKCGQKWAAGAITSGEKKTAYNAEEITCNDCLVAAISEGRP